MAKIHPRAEVQTRDIGETTTVWQDVIILAGAKIGDNCNICAHGFIENDVVIGDNVTLKCGVYIWDGTRIEDDVFIGPNATFTNDKYPRSKQYPEKFDGVTIRKGASIGANATLLPGVEIGEGAMVGAGAVVTKDVPARATVVGNPAQIIATRGETSIANNFQRAATPEETGTAHNVASTHTLLRQMQQEITALRREIAELKAGEQPAAQNVSNRKTTAAPRADS